MKAQDILSHIENTIRLMERDCNSAKSLSSSATDDRTRDRHAARRTALLDAMDIIGAVLEMARRTQRVTAKWYNECLTNLAERAINGDPSAALALLKLAPGFKVRVTA